MGSLKLKVLFAKKLILDIHRLILGMQDYQNSLAFFFLTWASNCDLEMRFTICCIFRGRSTK